MHEFAIAQSIKDIIYNNIKPYLDKSSQIEVELVKVRCGALSQIVPNILEEAFKAVNLEDRALKNTRLEVEIVQAKLECLICGKEYTRATKEEIFLPCPYCNSVSSNKLLEGKEMIVDHIEINTEE